MAPVKGRFWLPLVRLVAFLGAVVAVGNVLLLSAYTPGEADPVSDGTVDFLGRSRKRIEKRIRTFHRFLFGPGEIPVSAPSEGSGAVWLAAPEVEIQVQDEAIADAKAGASGLPVALAVSVVAPPETLPFVWPTLPARPSRLPVELSSPSPNTYRDTVYLLTTLPSLSSYRQAHRFLSLYLKSHGLYSAKFGYLGGIHLSLLLNRVVKLISPTETILSPATIVKTFFEYYANFNWAGKK